MPILKQVNFAFAKVCLRKNLKLLNMIIEDMYRFSTKCMSTIFSGICLDSFLIFC